MKTRKFIRTKFLFSLIMLLSLTSCYSSIESRITKKIANDSKTHYKVMFALKELTNFDWDRFYAFDPECSPKDISQALGFDYPYYKPSCRILVFIKNEKIAYHEENPKKAGNSSAGALIFIHREATKYYSCTFGNSYMRVEEKKAGEGIFYEIFAIQ